MSKVDDELTRRFHRAERPVGDDGLFEELERRRSHRERVRRVQAGALAFAVLAGTIAGFLSLRSVFEEDPTDIGTTPLPSNGEIVFSRMGDDGRFHLFAANPDGSAERQITDDATNDTDPAVSPDGKTIAFVHELDQGIRVVATVSVEGGTVTWVTGEQLDAHDPTWSADGTRLAFVGASRFEGSPVADSVVYLARPGTEPSPLLHNTAIAFADPSWSPDGRSVAVAVRDRIEGNDVADHWMIVEVGLDDPPQPGLGLTDVDEGAPAWSPDGSRLAFLRAGAEGTEVWTRSRDGGSETLLATAVEASLEPDLAWAPDGTALLVSDGDWIYRVDATPDGDPRENFVQLFRGISPSWQPAPADPSLAPDDRPQASPDADAGPDGYGFGIDICPQHVTWVTEQLDGLGGKDMAFVVIERGEDGSCPPVSPQSHLGVDLDGDQLVDMTYGPIRCEFDCLAFGAPDFDGDGRHEILLSESPGSIFRLGVYAIGAVGAPSSDTDGIVRVEVGEPGDPAGGFSVGEPVVLSVGGDEGRSYRLRCEDNVDGRFLVASSAFHEVDTDGPVRIHETRLAYGELRMIVVDVDDRSEPFSPDPLGPQPEELCGTPIPQV
jgi:hypothetical protein